MYYPLALKIPQAMDDQGALAERWKQLWKDWPGRQRAPSPELAYLEWLLNRMERWAAQFSNENGLAYPSRLSCAIDHGHTKEEFSAWLEENWQS